MQQSSTWWGRKSPESFLKERRRMFRGHSSVRVFLFLLSLLTELSLWSSFKTFSFSWGWISLCLLCEESDPLRPACDGFLCRPRGLEHCELLWGENFQLYKIHERETVSAQFLRSQLIKVKSPQTLPNASSRLSGVGRHEAVTSCHWLGAWQILACVLIQQK